MTTYTKVTLITGQDSRGNEYAYFKSDGEWLDVYSEVKTSARTIANLIIPIVVKVRFGQYAMTREEWQLCGCPFELNDEEMEGLRIMRTGETMHFADEPRLPFDRDDRDLLTSGKMTDMAYGQADLGTHFIISGGEMKELDGNYIEVRYDEQNGGDDLPF